MSIQKKNYYFGLKNAHTKANSGQLSHFMDRSLAQYLYLSRGFYPSYIYPMGSWQAEKLKGYWPLLDEKFLRMQKVEIGRCQQAVNGCESYELT